MTKRFNRYVALGSGLNIPLGGYVAAWAEVKRHPERVFKRGLCGWWPETGAEILRDFRRALDERITRAVPRSAEWPGPAPAVASRSPETRLLKRLRRTGRACRWCGGRFIPTALAQRCCADCRN